jgi:hypothetical protein
MRLCSPHSLQHLLDLAFGLRELLCIAGAQDDIGIRPVLRIEERIAADRNLRIGLGDPPSCIPMSFSRASARTVSESMRTPILSLGATSSSIACMIEGTPAITITLPIQKPGAPDTLLWMRSAPLGMRVMRRRASFTARSHVEDIGVACQSKRAWRSWRRHSRRRAGPGAVGQRCRSPRPEKRRNPRPDARRARDRARRYP